ncbi:MAG: apolipoprotein N-acyltransferase [Saprospiraceae bacterium]|nr:apolipoprotein N-acyltransferase [Saprospiraceae bacterium]
MKGGTLNKPNLLVLGLGVIGVITAGLIMLQRPLWGYWPLGLLLSFQLLYLYFAHINKPITASYKYAALGGILLGLGHLEQPLAYLDFIGMIPFLLILKKYREGEITRREWVFSLYFGLVLWNVISTFWVMNTAFVAGMIAVYANAFLMTLPWRLFVMIEKWVGRKLNLLILVSFWILFEFGHCEWEISWPWLTLGNSFGSIVDWVQWYEYTGVFGGSLWIWVINLLGYCVYLKQDKFYKITLALTIIVPVLISLFIKITTKISRENPRECLIIQPNYEPHYEKFNVPAYIQINHFKQLIESKIDSNTAYVILPETSFDPLNLTDLKEDPVLGELKKSIEKFPGATVISGLGGYVFLDRKNPKYLEGEVVQINGKDSVYCVANAVVMFDKGLDYQIYYKSKFVPGAEIFPYRNFLFFLKPLILKLGGANMSWMSQSDRTPFGQHGDKIAPIICYESVYGSYIGKFVKNGAQFLVVMTNDGWWDNTPGHRQHLNMSKLRCIETRKWMARSANTGISCFIDPLGKVIEPTHYDESAALNGKVYLNDEKTFYTEKGDWILWLIIFTLFGTLFLSVCQRLFIGKRT